MPGSSGPPRHRCRHRAEPESQPEQCLRRPNQIILICTASGAHSMPFQRRARASSGRSRCSPPRLGCGVCYFFLHARPNDLQPRPGAAAGDRPPSVPSQRGRNGRHATSQLARVHGQNARIAECGGVRSGHVTNACTLSRNGVLPCPRRARVLARPSPDAVAS